jgi:hypothetical protein
MGIQKVTDNKINKVQVKRIVSDEQVRALPDNELLGLHLRLHQLYGAAQARGRATEYPFFNVHMWVVQEMARRGMEHRAHGDLDEQTERMMKQKLGWLQERLESFGDAVLVPAYVSLVGSSVNAPQDARDFDILVRDDEERLDKGWRESVMLLARKLLAPDKERDLHVLCNPTGPHLAAGQGYVPLFDLVLRPRRAVEVVTKGGALVVRFIGTGAMNSRRKGAAILVEYGGKRVQIDGENPEDIQPDLDALLVTDPQAWNAKAAVAAGGKVGSFASDGLKVEPHKVEHTGHDVYGYKIEAGGNRVAYIPELWDWPAWADNVDVAIVDGSAWDDDIAFAGGVGGHRALASILEMAKERGVKRIIATHIGKQTEEALRRGRELSDLDIAEDGQEIRLAAKAKVYKNIPWNYRVMKPLMAGYTDFKDVDELWEKWGEKASQAAALYVSPKVDGFRTILRRDGDKISIKFEDLEEERAGQLPALAEAMRRGPDVFVIEGELQAKVGKRYVARPQIMSMLAGKLRAEPVVFLYEVLVWDGKDVHEQPFEDRIELINRAARALGPNFVALPQLRVEGKQELERAAQKLVNWQPPDGEGLAIEGVVARRADMPYVFGPTDFYVKTKRYVELKMHVLAVNRTESGYTYEVGLRKDGDVVSLGKTFVSEEKLADEGDTLNVMVEELLAYPDGRVAMGKPTPLGPDRSRPAYTVEQALDLARRYGVLKEVLPAEKAQEPAGEGGETRGEAALDNWEEHWHEAMPTSGRALRFVLHAHWRGLSKEEAGLSMEELLKTNHSLHWDLRLETDRFNGWWGITIFAGTTEENRSEQRIFRMMRDENEKLESTPKQFGPKPWLDVGLEEPLVVEPGGPGSTSRSYSKFFAIDHGTWRLGMARVHGVEVWLNGKQLKGRFMWQYAPLEAGGPDNGSSRALRTRRRTLQRMTSAM